MQKKCNINDMQNLAAERGGKCLSTEYINSNTKLKWECEKGHIWKATLNLIRSGSWCPECRKLTIEKMQQLAAAHGGKCRSAAYVNTRIKLEWECDKGHTWFATPASIKSGSWCPKCQKLTITEMQQIASERGGKCLSTEYVNINTPLEWECDKGHTWFVPPHTIKAGTWCPKCANQRRNGIKYKKHDIQEMQQLAAAHGGRCLSHDYFTLRIPLKWACDKGHTWETTPASITSGSWCPKCQKLTIEEMKQIASERGGKCLATKYVNAKTKLEWECDKGHTWFATPANIKYRTWCPECQKLTLEEMKRIASERGGKCLSTEYVNNNTPLTWECNKGHTWFATPLSIKYRTWCSKCQKLTIEEMQQIASERGGKCLSTEYVNNSTPLTWECDKGHTWETTPAIIKSGSWCPHCATQRKKYLNRFNNVTKKI